MKNVATFLVGALSWAAGNLGALGFLPHGVQAVVTAAGAVLGLVGIRRATTGPVLLPLNALGQGWKTIAGAVVAVLGYLSSPDVFAVLPTNVAHVVTTLGTLLAALGLFHRAAVQPRVGEMA